jgi:SAM-dependent methyltransferase
VRGHVSRQPIGNVFSPIWLSARENRRNVRKALASLPPGRLLDIGCGVMPFKCRGNGLEWVGMDVEGNPGADVHGSALALPFADGSFDYVLSTQVLEHLENPGLAIAECARVLRPNGVLILSAPQYWELHEEPYDYFRFTQYSLQMLCARHGLVVDALYREGCGVKLAGLTLNAALNHFGPRPDSVFSKALKAPLYLVINLTTAALSTLLRNDRDVQNYTLVASKAIQRAASR